MSGSGADKILPVVCGSRDVEARQYGIDGVAKRELRPVQSRISDDQRAGSVDWW
jgi:hypothetical protein